RLAPAARAALAAHGAPVEDDEVAWCDRGDVGADSVDGPRRLVTEQVREVVADAALAVVEVGVAHAARLHRDEHLTGAGVGHDDGLDAHRLALARRDDAAHLARHAADASAAKGRFGSRGLGSTDGFARGSAGSGDRR